MMMFLILLGMVAGLLQFIYVLAWWGNGCVKAGEALLLAIIDFILLFTLVASGSVPVQILIILLLFLPYIWVYKMTGAGSIREILEEELEKYKLAIQMDPRNLGAREYLAKTHYQLGDINAAIEEMTTIIQMNSQDDELKYRLRMWQEEKQEKDTGIIICPHCKTENEGSRRWCRKCEAAIYAFQPKSFTSQLGLKGFITVFACIAVVIASFVLLPTTYALISIMCLALVLGGWRLATARP